MAVSYTHLDVYKRQVLVPVYYTHLDVYKRQPLDRLNNIVRKEFGLSKFAFFL